MNFIVHGLLNTLYIMYWAAHVCINDYNFHFFLVKSKSNLAAKGNKWCRLWRLSWVSFSINFCKKSCFSGNLFVSNYVIPIRFLKIVSSSKKRDRRLLNFCSIWSRLRTKYKYYGQLSSLQRSAFSLYRNYSVDLQCKPSDWFLYNGKI